MSDNRPIGMFDSGVGGLSVFLEVKKLLPNESFIFLADQAHNPYGAKSQKELENLAGRITNFLLKKDIKLLIVACNTATCYAIDYLRHNFKIPIVGVVPAIKPAAMKSKKSKIVVMSTPATAKSKYLAKLISDFAPESQVLKMGCYGLEEAVEYLKKDEIKRILAIYAPKIKDFGADVVVLGCTHYPFLKSQIQKKLGKNVTIIDSGKAIAKRVKEILKVREGFAKVESKSEYFTTGDSNKFSSVASYLLSTEVKGYKAKI